jgi:hypothetical protein
MTTVNEGYLKLGADMAASCRENPEVFAECLVKFPSQRSVLFSVYGVLRTTGQLKMLENCDEETRRYYWDESKKLSAGRLPKEKLILLSKILYCLDHLLANY